MAPYFIIEDRKQFRLETKAISPSRFATPDPPLLCRLHVPKFYNPKTLPPVGGQVHKQVKDISPLSHKEVNSVLSEGHSLDDGHDLRKPLAPL